MIHICIRLTSDCSLIQAHLKYQMYLHIFKAFRDIEWFANTSMQQGFFGERPAIPGHQSVILFSTILLQKCSNVTFLQSRFCLYLVRRSSLHTENHVGQVSCKTVLVISARIVFHLQIQPFCRRTNYVIFLHKILLLSKSKCNYSDPLCCKYPNSGEKLL